MMKYSTLRWLLFRNKKKKYVRGQEMTDLNKTDENGIKIGSVKTRSSAPLKQGISKSSQLPVVTVQNFVKKF